MLRMSHHGWEIQSNDQPLFAASVAVISLR
jgi:hypothetical protein